MSSHDRRLNPPPAPNVALSRDPRDARIEDLQREISLLKTELDLLRDNRDVTLAPGTGDLLAERDALARYAEDLLSQLEAVLRLQTDGPDRSYSSFIAVGEDGEHRILAARGGYAARPGRRADQLLGKEEVAALLAQLQVTEQVIRDDHYSSRFTTRGGLDCLVYLESSHPFSRLDKGLLMLIAGNARADFESLHANQDVVDAQKEIIQTLGDVVESRSRETAYHTVRVSEYCFHLARLSGLSLQEARILQFAAPMHDVGKIGISDSILHKPGELTPAEIELIRTHTVIGHDILAKSERVILKSAALVAHQHHEKWDGSGYPRGLCGGEIHIYARILAIADVFDALSCDRVYRRAMPLDRIVAILQEERGGHFEPRLLDIFLEHLDEFVAIRDRYVDEPTPEPETPAELEPVR